MNWVTHLARTGAALALLACASCAQAPPPAMDAAKVSAVVIGQSSRTDVFAALGRPSRTEQSLLGETCYASLTEAAAALANDGVEIEIVDCFRKSEEIGPIADEAIAIAANCLWMQLGVINEDAARRAEQAGLIVVMDRCLKIDHMHAVTR